MFDLKLLLVSTDEGNYAGWLEFSTLDKREIGQKSAKPYFPKVGSTHVLPHHFLNEFFLIFAPTYPAFVLHSLFFVV